MSVPGEKLWDFMVSFIHVADGNATGVGDQLIPRWNWGLEMITQFTHSRTVTKRMLKSRFQGLLNAMLIHPKMVSVYPKFSARVLLSFFDNEQIIFSTDPWIWIERRVRRFWTEFSNVVAFAIMTPPEIFMIHFVLVRILINYSDAFLMKKHKVRLNGQIDRILANAKDFPEFMRIFYQRPWKFPCFQRRFGSLQWKNCSEELRIHGAPTLQRFLDSDWPFDLLTDESPQISDLYATMYHNARESQEEKESGNFFTFQFFEFVFVLPRAARWFLWEEFHNYIPEKYQCICFNIFQDSLNTGFQTSKNVIKIYRDFNCIFKPSLIGFQVSSNNFPHDFWLRLWLDFTEVARLRSESQVLFPDDMILIWKNFKRIFTIFAGVVEPPDPTVFKRMDRTLRKIVLGEIKPKAAFLQATASCRVLRYLWERKKYSLCFFLLFHLYFGPRGIDSQKLLIRNVNCSDHNALFIVFLDSKTSIRTNKAQHSFLPCFRRNNKGVFFWLKNGSRQVLPNFLNILEGFKWISKHKGSEDYVFQKSNGLPFSRYLLLKNWREITAIARNINCYIFYNKRISNTKMLTCHSGRLSSCNFWQLSEMKSCAYEQLFRHKTSHKSTTQAVYEPNSVNFALFQKGWDKVLSQLL